MEVIFHFIKKFKIYSDSTRVDLPILESKFRSFSAISLHYMPGKWGWVGGWGKLKLKLTQLEAGAELGKRMLTMMESSMRSLNLTWRISMLTSTLLTVMKRLT
jgi:hypothetical protein